MHRVHRRAMGSLTQASRESEPGECACIRPSEGCAGSLRVGGSRALRSEVEGMVEGVSLAHCDACASTTSATRCRGAVRSRAANFGGPGNTRERNPHEMGVSGSGSEARSRASASGRGGGTPPLAGVGCRRPPIEYLLHRNTSEQARNAGSDPAGPPQQPGSSPAARSLARRLAQTFAHWRGALSQWEGSRPHEPSALQGRIPAPKAGAL